MTDFGSQNPELSSKFKIVPSWHLDPKEKLHSLVRPVRAAYSDKAIKEAVCIS